MNLMKQLGYPSIIFWDFDGVIKESIDIKTNAFMQLFSSYGLKIQEKIKIHHEANGGMSRFKKIPIYLNYVGENASDEHITELCNDFSKLVFKNVIDCPWVNGAKEYLLENKYLQMFFLISATPFDELNNIIKELGISNCFSSIYGAPMTKIDAIKKILMETKTIPSDTIMIGDSQVDLDAAVANDVPFILRKTNFNKKLVCSYSGIIIEDITEL